MAFSITIIGMGACGVAAFAEATIRLAAAPLPGVELHLVSRDDDPGPGLAFGTDQPGHLLNTESRLMGLYANEPEHFRKWLADRRPLMPDEVEYAPARNMESISARSCGMPMIGRAMPIFPFTSTLPKRSRSAVIATPHWCV
ncbi:Uncharacterized protein conserved in bacteria [Sphingomonas paucimobilis]|nr:Uncharacterized protein conserved in bacteria [Sphingomonas paucimobilis]